MCSNYFSRYPENFQAIWKLSRLSRNSPAHPKTFNIIQQLLGQYHPSIFPDHPELSRLYRNFLDHTKTFHIIQQLFKQSENIPNLQATFQINQKKSWVCRNCHERRLCKICASCVNFPRKQRDFLHNLRRTTRFTHTNCDFALKLL